MIRYLWGKRRNILVLCSEGEKISWFAKKVAQVLFPEDKHTFFMIGINAKSCRADISKEGWSKIPYKNRKSLQNYKFDLIISEFCPIYNIKDYEDSAFSIATMNEIEQLIDLDDNPYLVVPTTMGDSYLFEINFGDRVHLVPNTVADFISLIKQGSVSYTAAFIPIKKLKRQIKSWERQYQLKKNENSEMKLKQQTRRTLSQQR